MIFQTRPRQMGDFSYYFALLRRNLGHIALAIPVFIEERCRKSKLSRGSRRLLPRSSKGSYVVNLKYEKSRSPLRYGLRNLYNVHFTYDNYRIQSPLSAEHDTIARFYHHRIAHDNFLHRTRRTKMRLTVAGVFLLLYLTCARLPRVTTTFDPYCGGHLAGPRGVIHTPNFPGPFSLPIKCRWVIDVSDIPSTNSSIVVYLTQLYVYKGLRFTEYAYYESETMNFGAALVKEVTEGNVFEYRRLRTFRPFLVVEFELDRFEGNHVRVLNDLLDVYGFNVTYEMTEEHPNPESCTMRDCSFAGNCLVSVDYTFFWCDCFDGFSGKSCNEGPLCFNDQHKPVCQNGAICRQIGAEAMHCDCLDGYVGPSCETRLLDTLDTECASENCILQCPFNEEQQPCTCKDGTKIYNNRSRYECRIKLSNVTSLRTGLISQQGSLESFVSKQESRKRSRLRSVSSLLREIQRTGTVDRIRTVSVDSIFPGFPGKTCGGRIPIKSSVMYVRQRHNDDDDDDGDGDGDGGGLSAKVMSWWGGIDIKVARRAPRGQT